MRYDTPHHDPPADGDTPGYRSVSSLAVAAAMVGVLSAVSLVGPAFWVVPLVAVALGAAALVEIGRPGSVRVGRPLALAGLALAVGFGTQAVAHQLVGNWIIATRSRAAAAEFVRAVREGRLADARSMCRSPKDPPAIDVTAAAEAFAAEPAVGSLAACGSDGEAVFSSEPADPDHPAAFVHRVRVFCGEKDLSGEATRTFTVVVERVETHLSEGSLDRWRVVRYAVEPGDAGPGRIP